MNISQRWAHQLLWKLLRQMWLSPIHRVTCINPALCILMMFKANPAALIWISVCWENSRGAKTGSWYTNFRRGPGGGRGGGGAGGPNVWSFVTRGSQTGRSVVNQYGDTLQHWEGPGWLQRRRLRKLRNCALICISSHRLVKLRLKFQLSDRP